MASSDDGPKFSRIIEKSVHAIENGKKPVIDYEVHPKLTPDTCLNMYAKVFSVTRFKAYTLAQTKAKCKGNKFAQRLTDSEK